MASEVTMAADRGDGGRRAAAAETDKGCLPVCQCSQFGLPIISAPPASYELACE